MCESLLMSHLYSCPKFDIVMHSCAVEPLMCVVWVIRVWARAIHTHG